jgi:hypothetical protein
MNALAMGGIGTVELLIILLVWIPVLAAIAALVVWLIRRSRR